MKTTLMWIGAMTAGLVTAVIGGYGIFYIMFCGAAGGLFC